MIVGDSWQVHNFILADTELSWLFDLWVDDDSHSDGANDKYT